MTFACVNMPNLGPAKARRAFTLIELLVVILILGILVALVIGVGKYVRDKARSEDTRNTMKLLANAIDTYYDKTGVYPAATGSLGDGGERTRNNALWSSLMSVDAAKAVAIGIKSDAMDRGNSLFLDGWGQPMDYLPTGGLAGRPMLVSRGTNNDFKNTQDNIYSDR